ncbi:MAG: hypothetical protein AAF962_03650 [Actinomycetota bacterium]
MLIDDTSTTGAAPRAEGAPPTDGGPSRLARALRIDWLGQTVASVCWIVSVFVYGIESAGDWLQLAAATSWLTANVATLLTDPD